MGWDGDHVGASVTAQGSAPRGASDRESDLLVATVGMLLMLPNTGTEKFVICLSSRQVRFAILSWKDLLGFDLGAFLFSAVEVRPPRSGQGASPGGGDL
jgi:hypothetical protein